MRTHHYALALVLPFVLGAAAPPIQFSKKLIAQSKHFCEAANPAPPGMMSNERPLSVYDPYYNVLSALLPEAPPGWSAEPIKVVAFSTDTIGCGASARRSFVAGERKARLEVMFSPILALQLAAPRNQRKVGRVFRLKGRYVVNARGTIMTFAGPMAVIVRGPASEADKLAVLRLVDLDAAEKF